MKKILNTLLIAICVITLFSCQKDYVANGATNANQSDNPLNPLDSAAFSHWPDSDGAFTVFVDGNRYNADSLHAYWAFNSVTGADYITAIFGSGKSMYLSLIDNYAGNVWNFIRYNQYQSGLWIDTARRKPFTTVLGNVGQIYMVRNDGGRISGRFYFQALDSVSGNVINAEKGFFNLPKY